MERKQVCFGPFSWLSARHRLVMLGLIELTAIALFIPPSINFVLNDGQIFYTTELAGKGREIGICSVVFMTVALIVITLMVIGTWRRKYWFIVPHIIWQVATIAIMSGLIYVVIDRMREDTVPESHRILRPAGVVLIIFFTIPTLLELWWVTVVTDACCHLRRQQLSQGLLIGSDTASFVMANEDRTPSPSMTSAAAPPSPLLSTKASDD